MPSLQLKLPLKPKSFLFASLKYSNVQIASLLADIASREEFWNVAKNSFVHQLRNNAAFKEFIRGTKPDNEGFGFMPVELFKDHYISCQDTAEVTFKSSGTTGQSRSVHQVFDAALYDRLSQTAFERIFGPLNEHIILALLPSYIENGESSLVHMINHFIHQALTGSEFVLNQTESLKERLQYLRKKKQKTILFGVSYALLDFAEQCHIDFPELMIMETGGMKGRREELTRPELHQRLQKGFPRSRICSEYGMTEMLSQAYSKDGHWFELPNWAHAYATDVSDPLSILPSGQRGLLAFIDLANYHSCAFIQTKDIGIVRDDGTFSVEGRLDNSDLRGCNLLYTQ